MPLETKLPNTVVQDGETFILVKDWIYLTRGLTALDLILALQQAVDRFPKGFVQDQIIVEEGEMPGEHSLFLPCYRPETDEEKASRNKKEINDKKTEEYKRWKLWNELNEEFKDREVAPEAGNPYTDLPAVNRQDRIWLSVDGRNRALIYRTDIDANLDYGWTRFFPDAPVPQNWVWNVEMNLEQLIELEENGY